LRCRSRSAIWRFRSRRIGQFDPGQTADQGPSLPQGGGPARCRAPLTPSIEKNRKLAKLREPIHNFSDIKIFARRRHAVHARGLATVVGYCAESGSICPGSRSRTTSKVTSARRSALRSGYRPWRKASFVGAARSSGARDVRLALELRPRLEDRIASRLFNRAFLDYQRSSAGPSICNLDLLLREATISRTRTRKSRRRVEVGNGSSGTHATHSCLGARIKMNHDG